MRNQKPVCTVAEVKRVVAHYRLLHLETYEGLATAHSHTSRHLKARAYGWGVKRRSNLLSQRERVGAPRPVVILMVLTRQIKTVLNGSVKGGVIPRNLVLEALM